jgi:LPS export ABC transporter protein LptC
MINGSKKFYTTNHMKNFFCIFLVILFASINWQCESNLKEVQKIYKTTFVPTGQADSINLKYTDSGKVKSILLSKKMIDYSTAKNPFVEFPQGIKVTLIDDQQRNTVVTADKAISYSKTEVIDLIGNVKILSHDGALLETQQLYFDQKNEWFFTESFFKFQDSKGSYLQGTGIDFSKDFKVFNMQSNTGEVNGMK